MNFSSWPKFDERCWNYHMIPVHSRAVTNLLSGTKKNGKIVSEYFAVFPIILRLIGHYFALVGQINTTSLTRECSCILCPNVENFCPKNGQFFSFGNATASPCRMLWLNEFMFCKFQTNSGNRLFLIHMFGKKYKLLIDLTFCFDHKTEYQAIDLLAHFQSCMY